MRVDRSNATQKALVGRSCWARLRLQEGLTTSDFSTLFGDVIDRTISSQLCGDPRLLVQLFCKRAHDSGLPPREDFPCRPRKSRLAVLDVNCSSRTRSATSGAGSNGIWEPKCQPKYPMRKRVASDYTDQLYKFGARMDFAWETLINDDLDALKDTPALFGRAARRTEEERATKLYSGSGGPNSSFFSNGNKNVVNATVLPNLSTFFGLSNNPHLSITSLQAAMVIMANQVDLDGMPISIEGATLVVPPSLKITAMNIVNAVQVWMNDQGGTYGDPNSNSAIGLQRLITENWAKSIVKIAVNYFAPIVNTTNGNSAWYLFSDPNNGRPALQQSFLRGHESPELFMKLPNSVQIGEGRIGPGQGIVPGTMNVNPLDGDFDTDSIAYKIRHVLGGTLLDPIMAVASNGPDS